MTGIFRCDPGCQAVTVIGTTHSVFATIAALAMIFGMFAIGPRMHNDSRWRGYVSYTLATVVVTMVVSALFAADVFEEWHGALQRISMGLGLVWAEVMAFRLLRLSSA